MALASLPVLAAVVHGLLMLFAGPQRPRRGYEATFRTLAYTSGSAALLLIVPCTGDVIAWVWGVCVAIAGLAAIHETTPGVAAAALSIPLALGCGMLVGAWAIGAYAGMPI